MIIFANVLAGIAFVLETVFQIMIWTLVINSLISWFSPDPYNPIVRFLRAVCDPLLAPIRRKIPPIGPGIDLSPLIVLLVIYFLSVVLVGTLRDYSYDLRRKALTSLETSAPCAYRSKNCYNIA